MGHRLEPSPKAAGRIVAKVAHLPHQAQQYLLGHVVGLRFAGSPLARPVQQQPPVTVDELTPGGLVELLLLQSLQQADRGVEGPGAHAGYFPRGCQALDGNLPAGGRPEARRKTAS